MIEEIVGSYIEKTDSGKLRGRMVYTYASPTHWSSDGICRIILDYGWGNSPEVYLQWGAGGVNKEATEYEIAVAMAEAFKMASVRIAQLERHIEELKGQK
jgi:hypothetical protein